MGVRLLQGRGELREQPAKIPAPAREARPPRIPACGPQAYRMKRRAIPATHAMIRSLLIPIRLRWKS